MFAVMTTQRAIGYVFIAVVVIGGVLLVWSQMRKGRKEAGSEIVLAPNRGPGQTDEELEGPRLNMALWGAFALMIVVGLSLPIYWLAEGGRQAGAVKGFDDTFIRRGLEIYEVKAQCVNCHGPEGVGGQASFIITDENGEFVDQVNWAAPALDNVLWRFSEAEVKDVLEYGRPGSPMAAWGTVGGGPLSDQQLDNVIDYLWSVQLTEDEMREQVGSALEARDPALADRLAAVQEQNAEALATDPTAYECTSGDFACLSEADNLLLGEILFSLNEVGAGAYSCARCHVPGASFGAAGQPISEIARGRFGPRLEGIEDDLTLTQHFNLIMRGSEFGRLYGANKIGSGRMPGFGLNPNQGDTSVPQLGPNGMLTAEEVWAITIYERNLTVQNAIRAGLTPPAEAVAAAETEATP